jgi:putative holliday junction resolvase
VTERMRILGIDYGSVRIGLAISDSGRCIASPHAQYQRSGVVRDAAYFRQLIQREDVGAILIGLPVHLDGREGAKSIETRRFAGWLSKETGLAPVFWDERFTTVEAEGFLSSAGLTSKRRKARRDQVAAQIILQSYLDAGCPPEAELRALDK